MQFAIILYASIYASVFMSDTILQLSFPKIFILGLILKLWSSLNKLVPYNQKWIEQPDRKETEDLNITINQLDLTDIDRILNNSRIHILKCTRNIL